MFVLFMVVFIDELLFLFFFFNDTATTEIYTLSLHDALPIFNIDETAFYAGRVDFDQEIQRQNVQQDPDRKSTRLNSSHANISYAVFCLKKKKKKHKSYYTHNHTIQYYTIS